MVNPLPLYRAATVVLGPAVRLYLARRRAQGKEDPARFRERFGHPSRPRPSGPLLWLHAASVGEATSALALVDRLRRERPSLAVLVTTGTVTSARLLASRLEDGRALHQYVPIDRPVCVRRFLDHWRPDLAVWIESELWPNLVVGTDRRGVPMLLLNGRLSARSFARWRRWPAAARSLLGAFALCLAQDELQAGRLSELGAEKVRSVGDLKSAAAPLPADTAEKARLAEALGDRPLWLAASTHPGEEDAAATVHSLLAEGRPELLTVIAPRHPKRGDEIAAMLAAKGHAVRRRSKGEMPDSGTAIYLVDTLGELGLFYRLAGIVFVGGSLTPVGGHNPLEPALLDCAVLHGPDMTNCAAIARELEAAGGAVAVDNAEDLASEVGRLLDDPDSRARQAGAAAAIAARHRGVLDAVLGEMAPWLDRIAPIRAHAVA